MGDDDKLLADMAKMLLSKATMLQYHCGNCKSPLFEKEGQVLCPRCGPVKVVSPEEAAALAAKETEKQADTPPAKSTLDPATRGVLEKKKAGLLAALEKEEDPTRIKELLEALEKITGMLE